MKLLKAHINNFGKLQDKTINFHSHLQVIYGNNESGKTTIHNFIRSMLFGLNRSRGRASKNDLYSRYLPWNSDGVFGGTILFSHNQNTYAINRRFQTENRLFEIQTPESQKIPPPSNQEELNELLKMNEQLYDNTLSIRQLKVATNESLASELKNYVANLSTTGSGALDLTSAVADLQLQKKQLTARLSGQKTEEYARVKKQMEALENELRGQDPAADLNRMTQKRREVENEIKEKTERQIKLQNLVDKCKAAFKGSGLNNKEDLDSLMRILDNAYGTYKRLNSQKNRKTIAIAKFLSWGLFLASFTSLFFANKFFISGNYPFAILFVALCLAGFLSGRKLQSLDDQNDLYDAAKEQLLSVFTEFLNESEITEENFQKAKTELENYRILWDKLCVGEKRMNETLQEISGLQNELGQLTKKVEELQHRQWDYDKKLDGYESLLDLQEQLQKQKESDGSLNKEITAISHAISTINALSENLHKTLSPQLNEATSQILNRLTSGAYSGISIDDSLSIQILTNYKKIPLESLSQGTVEQVYMAFRLAVIALLWPDEPVPLILDDSFAYYDNNRLRDTLTWLESNYPGQILLFTCHDRELEILKEHNIEYNLTHL